MKSAQTRIKLLIVDDSPEDREAYMRHLKKDVEGSNRSNYSISAGETGQQGIQLCNDENPDCILLDYLLPDMDGLEFLSIIKEKGYPGAIIILTGQGSETLAVEAIKGGAQDYLVKNNFSSQALNSAIFKAVNSNERDKTKK